MGVVDYRAFRRAPRTRSLAEQVLVALEELGGAAHVDVIAARVNIHLRTGESRPSASLIHQVEETLRASERGGAARKRRVLFVRVFGPGTHRWALAEHAVRHIAPVQTHPALVGALG